MTAGVAHLRADRRTWGLVGAIGGLQVLAFADRFLLSLLAVPVARDLRMSDLDLGLLQGSAFIAPFVLASLVFGRLADRRGPRELLLVGLAAWTTATVATALARDARELLAARILLAVGEAAVAPVGLALIAERVPGRRLAVATSVFTGAGPLGKGLALLGGGGVLALLGASAATRPGGWREVFLIAAALNLLAAPLLWTLLGEAGAPSARPGPRTRPPLWGGRPLELAVYAGAGCAAVLASQAVAAWAPAHFHRSYGMSVAQAGAMAGAPLMLATPLGGALAALALDRLGATGRRTASAPVVAASLALAAAAAGVFLAGPSGAPALAGYVVLAFALGGATASFLAGMQARRPPDRAGEFASWVVAISNLVGFGVGPALAGWLSDGRGASAAGLRGALLEVVGAACLAGAAAALAAQFLAAHPRPSAPRNA